MRLTKDGFSSEDELRSANDLQSWSMGDVTVWLEGEGLGHLVEVFKQHRIDGKVLLAMTEGDLRSPPLSLSCLGDIKKISMALDKLRRVHRRTSPDVSPSDTERLYNSSLPPTHTKRNRRNRASSPSPVSRGLANEAKPTRPLSSESRYLADLFKLTMAGLFLMVVSFLTSFTMTVVHERLPDPSLFPPLPDIILDSVPHIPWAFEAAEVLCLMLASTVAIICVFHSFRIAIATRLLAILGAVFLLRCLTMFVTSLSVPGVHLSEPCMAGRKNRTLEEKLRMALEISSGGGMSLQGITTCGDYMFSGHTAVLTTLAYTIIHYTPSPAATRRRHSLLIGPGVWHWLHTCVWITLLFGMFFILAAHEHYTVDVMAVVVSYYISSRCFMNYHVRAAAWIRSRQNALRSMHRIPSFDHVGDLATTSTMQYTVMYTSDDDSTQSSPSHRERHLKRQYIPLSSFPLFAFFEGHRDTAVYNKYEIPLMDSVSSLWSKYVKRTKAA